MSKFYFYNIVATILLLFTACNNQSKEYQTITTKSGSWELVWNDEFDYTGLPDSTKWSFDTEGNSWAWGNNEDQWYTANRLENANVADGLLNIIARKEESNGKQYTSARLRTKNKGDWKYGRIEVRAQIPSGRGTWAAIWALPTDDVYGSWPGSGEIDILEHVGYNPDSIFSTVHTQKFNHIINTQVGETIHSATSISEFHVYGIEWDENEIRSFIDDNYYFTFPNNGIGHEAWPFDQRHHLLLNLAIGGGLGGKKGVDDSLFPHTFQIDYVRVYQKVKLLICLA